VRAGPNDRDAVRDGAEAVGVWSTRCSTATTLRAHLASTTGVFHQADNLAIESALSRALGVWSGYPAEFRQLAVNAMRAGYSWTRPGHDYLSICECIRRK
jgi:glycogen synthase